MNCTSSEAVPGADHEPARLTRHQSTVQRHRIHQIHGARRPVAFTIESPNSRSQSAENSNPIDETKLAAASNADLLALGPRVVDKILIRAAYATRISLVWFVASSRP